MALIATSPNWSVQMTKLEAVIAVIRASGAKRPSRAALLRIERACKTLGLTQDNTAFVLCYVGYDPTLRERLKGAKG